MVVMAGICAGLLFSTVAAPPIASRPAESPLRSQSPAAAVSLPAAIALAKDHDPDLRYLRELHAAERYRIAEQYRAAFPRVRVSYSHSDTVQYGGADTRIRRVGIGLEQLLYNGGRTRRAVRLARTERDLRRITVEQHEREIEMTVIRAYLQAIGLARRIQISRQNLAIAEAQLQVGEKEHLLARTTELSLRELRLAVLDQELALRQLRVERDTALKRLTRLIHAPGETPPLPILLQGELDLAYTGILSQNLAQAGKAGALQDTRRYAEQQAFLDRAVTQEQIARRGILPRVTADGELSISGREFPLNEPGFSLGVRIELTPAYGSASLRGNVGSPSAHARTRSAETQFAPVERLERLYSTAGARSERLRAEAAFAHFDRALAGELQHELDEIALLRSQAALLRSRISAQQDRVHIVSTQVDIGEIPRLQVLKAVSELNVLENSLADHIVRLFERELALLDIIGADIESRFAAIIEERAK